MLTTLYIWTDAMIKFIFLMVLSVSVVATELEDCNDPLLDIQCIQLTWSAAELREDGSFIQAVESWMNDIDLFIVSIIYEHGNDNLFYAYITYRELKDDHK